MIVAEQKDLSELKKMMKGKKKVLAVGCGTCVSVCFAGGQKETSGLAAELSTAAAVDGESLDVDVKTVQRQCVQEFIEPLSDDLKDYDAVLSLGCGVGVQTLAGRFPDTRILPGLDTQFMGQPVSPGVWEERCVGCGNCVLEYTGGLCPITRCPKQLFNGPCGGSEDGMCEVDLSLPCVWSEIWGNAENLDLTDTLMEIHPPQDWSTSRSGGLRRTVVREDLHQPSAVATNETEEIEEVEAGPKPESPEDAFLREIGII
jgi:ferredoxin